MAAHYRIIRSHPSNSTTNRQVRSDAEMAEAIQFEEVLRASSQFEEVLRASSASAEIERNEGSTSSGRNFAHDFDFELVQRPDNYDDNNNTIVRPTEDRTCVICLEEISFSFPHSTGIRIAGCDHDFCEACLRRFLKLKMVEKPFPITCPEVGCTSIIESPIAEIVLDEENLEKWWVKSAELAIGNKIHCPNSSCSAPLDLDPDFSNGNLVQCPMCKFSFCASCRVSWHHNMTCQEYQALPEDERNPEDQLVFGLAHEKRWQRCPKCRVLIERNHGCNHMRCPCGTEFCYVCGTIWQGECTHRRGVGRGRNGGIAVGLPMPMPMPGGFRLQPAQLLGRLGRRE